VRVKELRTRPAPSVIRDLFSRVVRGRGPAEKVERRQVPYWQEQGWVRQGNRYQGAYHTPYGAFPGWIEQRGGSGIDFFMYEPPEALRQHSHWSCFQDRGQNWYRVHMSRQPADVSSGILTIERLITEAFEQ
jgi:hypothetical protein